MGKERAIEANPVDFSPTVGSNRSSGRRADEHLGQAALRKTEQAMTKRPSAFTLVEILVATTLALMLLAAVVTIFGNVAQSITESRSMLEMAEQLRLTATRLQQDLAGRDGDDEPTPQARKQRGLFRVHRRAGGLDDDHGGATPPLNPAVNTDNSNSLDTTVGDFDDILMFTTRSTGRPFVGK